jgi:hypothetical protein
MAEARKSLHDFGLPLQLGGVVPVWRCMGRVYEKA